MSGCNQQWWIDRLNSLRELIVAYEAAKLDLTSGAISSYTLDTGQTRQTVTKQNLLALNMALDGLYNQVATLEARIYGCGRTYVRPGF